ncbi:MAG: hypothetical protein NZ552_09695, partial [Planctomycetes bacterium]|nr:hypothetical protein [Planctomycetota bacterium]
MTRLACLAVLLPACALAGDPPLPPPVPRVIHTAQAAHTIRVEHSDPASLAGALLFVTQDNGKSWQKAQEITASGDGGALAFPFVAAADGAYGFWTVALARDGRRDAEPLPGMPPKLVLVVDRTPPSLGRLDVTLGSVAERQATLAVSWQVSDPNFGEEPVTIEASTDEGKSFSPLRSGDAEGTTAIVVPIAGREIQVRLVARDLAGNVLTSPARSVLLPAEALPRDPEAELAAAVAALPTPDQLGVGRPASPIVSARTALVSAPETSVVRALTIGEAGRPTPSWSGVGSAATAATSSASGSRGRASAG